MLYCFVHWHLARYVKFWVAHVPGMPETFPPQPRVSDPDMQHGTCVTHVPWCILGSLTSGFIEVGGGENVSGIPGACPTRNFTYLVRGPLHYLAAVVAKNAVMHFRWYAALLININLVLLPVQLIQVSLKSLRSECHTFLLYGEWLIHVWGRISLQMISYCRRRLYFLHIKTTL